MNNLFFIAVVCSFIIGCAQGGWVKEGANPETAQKDFQECQTQGTTLEPTPATLGDKVGGNPDMSTQAVENCMRDKGYRWRSE